ncbi:hypothetical protein [uncultured Erythrobacter sp.]|uniref:hypothetical protein n=1 Tax=uncultured Erythrobacter sp. TaxID=263913 RepID=UPI00260289C6|nr:hypothetical protein [uncultured Erythrobacter sp.]
MNLSNVALLATAAIIVIVAIDWRRGRTGLGKFYLDKEEQPERFWFALCLYLNMAFAMFWLSGQVEEPMSIMTDGETIILHEEASQ